MSDLLDKARAAWNNLSPREQILLGILGAGLGLSLLLFGLIMPFVQMSDQAHQRVASVQREIQVMQRLARDHAEIQSRLAGVEQRILNQQGRQNIKTLLESLAQESSVRIASHGGKASREE